MADNNLKLPEQQPILDGIPLNERQIRFEVRRQIKLFKLEVRKAEERRLILGSSTLERHAYLENEIIPEVVSRDLKKIPVVRLRALTAPEFINIKKKYLAQLEEDLSRFLVLNDAYKSRIRDLVAKIIEECVMEELLTSDFVEQTIFEMNEPEKIEYNNIALRAQESRNGECVVIPRTTKI